MAQGVIKPEYAGQTHPDFGLLVAGVIYDGIEQAPQLFDERVSVTPARREKVKPNVTIEEGK